jgi:hypothetical protein
MIGAAVHDPQRQFATDNCRIAKRSLDHLVGAGEQCLRSAEASHCEIELKTLTPPSPRNTVPYPNTASVN